MNQPAAIYARVSSDRQKDNHRIASQTAALKEYAQQNGHAVPAEWVFAIYTEQGLSINAIARLLNERQIPTRTGKRRWERSTVWGMLVCQQCGYALFRASTRTSKRKLYYYRCLGSDGYRRLKGPVCTNRPIRQDYLDEFVWKELIQLLHDPSLIRSEIDRRMEVAQQADSRRKRQEELRRERARLENSTGRFATAYQEGLLTLAELRQRIPQLRKQQQAVESALHSLEMAAAADARTGTGGGPVAGTGAQRFLPIPRGAGQLGELAPISGTDRAVLAARVGASQPAWPVNRRPARTAVQTLAAPTPAGASLSSSTL